MEIRTARYTVHCIVYMIYCMFDCSHDAFFDPWSWACCLFRQHALGPKCKKVNVSHTRYRTLGPELILVVYSCSQPADDYKSSTAAITFRQADYLPKFPAAEHHRPLAGTKLYCLVTQAHRCEQLAHCCCAALPRTRVGFEPTGHRLLIASPTLYA